MDEDKWPFVKRRVLATLLGGYRLVFNEEDDESQIPFHLHIFQILIYFIMPAVTIILTQVLKEDRKTAVIIGGFIPLGLNFVIQMTSYIM